VQTEPLPEPQYSIEAEMAVLGAMLLGETAAVTLGLSLLTGDDFYRVAHTFIFEAMKSLHSQLKPVDMITLPEEIKRLNPDRVLDVIGLEYLFQLSDIEFTTSNLAYYAAIVKEKARLRSLSEIGQHLFNHCRKPDADSDEVLGSVMQKLLNLQARQKNTVSPLSDLVRSEVDAIIRRGQGKAAGNGIPTGFESLDFYAGAPGMRRADLFLLAARPSVGKTSLAVQIGVNAAKKGYPVLFFSLEMSKEQISQRLITTESRTDSHALRSGELDARQWEKVMEGANRLYGCPFWVADASDQAPTPMYLRSVCQGIKAKEGLSLVIVDYIGLMSSGRKNDENRNQEIGFISRSLKLLAKELDVPILALSQLSRDVERRENKRPVLSDLRDSGSLEQDADIVAFIHREDYAGNKAGADAPVSEIQGAEVIFRKNRMGPTGTVNLVFTPAFTRFDDKADGFDG
jgi:replicative DNA helicase